MLRSPIAAAVLATAGLLAVAAPLAFAQEGARGAQADIRHAAEAARVDPRNARNGASLDGILADAQRRHPGRVIEVSYDDGEYDIEIRRNDGRIVELEYSARTGRLLDTDYDD
ncbi:hypothetical protein LDO26_09020 [Luteimonas sp. BDR2-5]|uniref:PepSY domain-containing protein n=1 Tax=Proluteimonas luteida TaxID=2878685 RepID=UPI001E5EE3F7|nr:hypothetical protein [Luteimonas sp. BDR2-5]MCD9028349.1 hypothetical protein [Luteimonas sp. BDR2-5]